MKILVMGCGAMGSIYAGLLAGSGNDVVAVDTWREHVAAMRDHGLRVEGRAATGWYGCGPWSRCPTSPWT